MDPPSMINEASSFPSANGSSSYNLAEIWQFPITGGGVGDSGGVLGARGAHFGGGFGERREGNREILVEESTVTEKSGRSGAGGRKRRDVAVSDDESSKLVSTSSGNEMNDSDVKRLKASEFREENGASKAGVGASSGDVNKPAEQGTEPSEPPKQDYIHVRARRGQATDSHSLAERARREKISERMKILQDLVPGCNKNDSDVKRLKASEFREENGASKAGVGASSGDVNKPAEQGTEPSEPPKQDYIHVRARRGQATDSHSLAERARREKISERMKILQDLVPGCNKVIGKSMVLDEIINYIQSLQRQVEFLSMKLEAVNSRLSPSIERFPSKDFGAQAFDSAGMAFSSQAAREYGQGSPQEWLHMQVGGNFERAP